MKKQGILNMQLAKLIAGCGHFDYFAVVDAGCPIPKGVEIVDLALTAEIPGWIDVLKATFEELGVETCTVANELFSEKHGRLGELKALIPDIQIDTIPHAQFKKELANMKFVVRTGECLHFCNAIFMCGVSF